MIGEGLRLLGQAGWLALPVVVTAVLHMVVVKKGWLAGIARPVDGGRLYRGKPLFGPNKTWRGFFVMTVGAGALGAVQGGLAGEWAAGAGWACLDYEAVGRGGFSLGYLLVNLVLGFGYVLGELPNSFLKRRIGIASGKTEGGLRGRLFLLLDQADSVATPLLMGWLLFGYSFALVLVALVTMTGVHFVLNGLLYVTGVRRNL